MYFDVILLYHNLNFLVYFLQHLMFEPYSLKQIQKKFKASYSVILFKNLIPAKFEGAKTNHNLEKRGWKVYI